MCVSRNRDQPWSYRYYEIALFKEIRFSKVFTGTRRGGWSRFRLTHIRGFLCYTARWRNFPATLQGHNPFRPPVDGMATWSEITSPSRYTGCRPQALV